jgi:DNA-binding response OmpR family regulator
MDKTPIRLLLVDDEEDAFILLRSCISEIRGTKYKLDWVDSVDAAFERLAKREHDVYLVDYQLGGREGTEVLHEAKRLGITAPVIMLTGMGLRETDVECMKLGAADYLNKDFLYAAVFERVVRYSLDRQRLLENLTRESAYRERAQTLQTIGEEFKPCAEAIFRMAQLLDKTALSPEQSHYVKAILTASESLSRLTEHMHETVRAADEGAMAKHRAA